MDTARVCLGTPSKHRPGINNNRVTSRTPLQGKTTSDQQRMQVRNERVRAECFIVPMALKGYLLLHGARPEPVPGKCAFWTLNLWTGAVFTLCRWRRAEVLLLLCKDQLGPPWMQ